MGKKIFVWILTANLLFTAGCAKKVEDISKNGQEETEVVVEESDIMTQLSGADNWKENFSIMHKGEEKTVEIDSKVVLPDKKNLPVIEGRVLDFDEGFKEKTARYLFKDTDIYLADDAHMTREDLKVRINELEKRAELFNREPAWENLYKTEMENLENCQEYLKNAKDSYTVTADNFKEDHYVANRDDIWYVLDFEKIDDWNYYAKIRYEAKELKDVAPKSIPECDYVEIENGIPNLRIENSCRYSLEEARKMVDEFLKEMGLLDMNITKEYPLEWTGWNIDGEYDPDRYSATSVGSEVNGYKFVISLVKDQEVLCKDEFHTGKFGGEIAISDAGIVSATFLHPFAIEKISENIKLLSLNQIEEGFRQELKNNAGRYISAADENSAIKYTELELMYLPVNDEKEPERISFLPCWKLEHKNSGDSIYLNAVDGSVIPEESIVW